MAAETSSAAKDLACGTVAGIGQLLLGHPFDTVKVKLQSQSGKYNGPGHAARQIIATHGPKGLLKGLTAPLATVAAFNAVLFATRGSLERILAHPDGSPLSIADQSVCGATAGFAGSFMLCPTELIKCRLQARNGAWPPVVTQPAMATSLAMAGSSPCGGIYFPAIKPGPLAVASQVVAAGGLGRLYTGMIPTLCREVTGSAVMFATFEAVKRQLAHRQGVSTSDLGQGSLLASGWHRRLQIDDLQWPRFAGMLDCAQQVHRELGMRGFFAGFQPAIIRAFFANAVAFCLFESSRKALA